MKVGGAWIGSVRGLGLEVGFGFGWFGWTGFKFGCEKSV